MDFTVLEQFVEGKSGGRQCEDIIVVARDFAAVIDGASDETGARFAGMTGGRFAAEVIATTMKDVGVFDDARAFADSLARSLAQAVADEAGSLDADVRWPSAAVIYASAQHREIWRIGDGNVMINGAKHLGAKRIDDAAYSFRAAVNAALLNGGTPLEEIIEHDPGAQAARPLFDNQQQLANKVGPWGFGCLNGQRVPDDYIEVLPIPHGSSEVIITSDGFPVVRTTLAETEKVLAGLIERDPAAIGELWAVGKAHKPGANAPDDRAYLRLHVP